MKSTFGYRVLWVLVLLSLAPWLLGAAQKITKFGTVKADMVGAETYFALTKENEPAAQWTAKGFSLLDSKGQMRLYMSVAKDKDTGKEYPMIQFLDANGEAVGIIAEEDGKLKQLSK